MELIIEKDKEIDNSTIYIKIYKLHKSYLMMISDHEEMGIGNVSLGNPPTIAGIKASVASFELFGLGNNIINKVIVERAASFLKAPVLLLFFLRSRTFEESFLKSLIKFLNDILNEINIDK